MLKFIHAADIHLDSPLRGLQRYEGAPVQQIREASRRALENLVDLAITERVAFVLFVGDLYDGDWKDYNTGLFFATQMTKLREVGAEVFVIAGNHDAASQLTKYLRLPENVTVLSTEKPESKILEKFGVALHGQGFSSRVVTRDLSAAYPAPFADLFNIGLLHTSMDGREGHEPYAPCSLQSLLTKGYDYWALGHIHKREVLHQNPWILFPGNLQGRHVRETGPKGCTLVTLEDGHVLSAEHQDLDVLRWSVCDIATDGAQTGEEILERIACRLGQEISQNSGHPLAARISLYGSCRAHGELSSRSEHWTNEIRTLATDLSGGTLWIEKVMIQTRMEADLEDMLDRGDALGGLMRALQNLNAADPLLGDLAGVFRDLHQKLPSELRRGEDAIDFDNPGDLRQTIIEDIKHLLLTRLL